MSDNKAMRVKVFNALIWGLALIAAIFIGFGIHHLMASLNSLKDKEIAFVVEDKNGKEVELDDFNRKPIVVNFWAIWCPPCKAELPAFQNVYNEYKGKIDFLFVNLINWRGETTQEVEDFMSENGYSFPVYYDTKDSAANACNVSSIPLTLFINKDGKVIQSYNASMSETLLRNSIEQLLD